MTVQQRAPWRAPTSAPIVTKSRAYTHSFHSAFRHEEAAVSEAWCQCIGTEKNKKEQRSWAGSQQQDISATMWWKTNQRWQKNRGCLSKKSGVACQQIAITCL